MAGHENEILDRSEIERARTEVDKVEVEVLEAPVSELLLADRQDILSSVEGVPELGDDEEILTLHEAVGDGALGALAALLLVAVV